MISAKKIHVTGIVQGVGFRPFVYRQAKLHMVCGWVLNSDDGVHIHAEAEDDLLDAFILAVANDAPPAAQVEQVEIDDVPLEGFEAFEIRHSKDKNMSHAGDEAGATLVSPDLATCDDCVRELFSRRDRRYRYSFINCTNCGPRFTIIDALPYDRAKTSMRDFEMCEQCQAEYDDPFDRRFHAQPDACFECGPQISWVESAQNTDASGKNAMFKNTVSTLIASENVIWAHNREESDAIIKKCVNALLAGKIVAIKGLGGFHLACDAGNNEAVSRLRQKKERSNKAFAIMAADVSAAKEICKVGKVEKGLLEGPQRPIVLLRKKVKSADMGTNDKLQPDQLKENKAQSLTKDQNNNFSPKTSLNNNVLAPQVTMGLPEVGVMLPYTPLQHLILHDFCAAGGKFLVMTSGNVYDNPIVTDDQQAYAKLGRVADAFLGNNRKILSRYDDSVVRVIDAAGTEAIQMIRRARGYAPAPIKLKLDPAKLKHISDSDNLKQMADSDHFKQKLNSDNLKQKRVVFAAGPEQKNTFAYLRYIDNPQDNRYNAEVFVSQHIGDLENAQVMDAWQESKGRFQKVFRLQEDVIVHDLHPEYLSTKWALEQKKNWSSKTVQKNDTSQNSLETQAYGRTPRNIQSRGVQHHFAHVASVIAENQLEGPVLGFAFDGTGYGPDGNIWGGEALICNTQDYERFANFAYAPMPGGAAAIKNPLRMAYGLLWSFDLLDHPGAQETLKKLGEQTCANLQTMVEQGINCPQTSSLGRVFDAASALLGICETPSYEGESAIMLEAALWDAIRDGQTDPGVPFDPRYELAITKNVGTTKSTAHDTSVLLLDCKNTFKAILDDTQAGVPLGTIIKNFHDAIVLAVATTAQLSNQIYGITQIALSGGVFMNRYLIERIISVLTTSGYNVAINRDVPPNDGGVSLGQAFVGESVKNFV